MLSRYNLPWRQHVRNGPAIAETDYHYEPLPYIGWIRLLKLKPGKEDEGLDCELEPCSIDLLPQYEALSYSMYMAIISFHIFCHSVCFQGLRNAKPSWVADLLRFRRDDLFSKLEYCYGYCAGTTVTQVKAVTKINDARSVITLRGLHLGVIHSSAPPFGNPDFNSDATSQELLQLTLDFAQRDRNNRRSSHQNRVLFSSLILVAGKCDLEGGNQQANFYAYCKEFPLSPAVSIDPMNEASVTSDKIMDYAERGNSRENYTHAWAACYGSKLFRTAKDYLGLGPEILKTGDIVAVIFGAQVPFILRREGDRYLLVGDAMFMGSCREKQLKSGLVQILKLWRKWILKYGNTVMGAWTLMFSQDLRLFGTT